MTTRAFPKVPWSLRKPIKANPRDHFSAEELEKSKSYQRPLQYVGLAGSIISTAVGLTLVGTKIFPTWAEKSSLGWPLQLVAVIAAIILVTQVISLPLGIWAEFGHERKWGFSTQTPGRYAGDQLKGLLLGVVLLSILFIPVWMLIRSTELWWVFGGLIFMAFSVFVAFILPVVIMPIFNKFTPLEDESLRTRLADLATKAGVSISDYQVMDASKRTRKDNAFF
ncbi:MAG TPA: hypothetical protein VI541_02495, partial [Actinomycetota bacterium]|nr:hypothetical protein [Actinomycetota bacterium]